MDGKQQGKIRPQDQAAHSVWSPLRVTVPEIWPGQKSWRKKKNNEANWMVSNSAKLDSKDQAAHSIWSLYEWRFQRYGADKIVAGKKMNVDNPI